MGASVSRSEGLDPEGVVDEFLEKLADRRRHLVFLLGAGASCSAGLPDLRELSDRVRNTLQGDVRRAYDRLSNNGTENLELVLTRLRLIAATLADLENQIVLDLNADEATAVDKGVCSAIAKVILEQEVDPSNHLRFARWLASTSYDRPVEIFTTNYDLLLESGLEAAGVPYTDGFVGVYNARFRADLIEDDLAPPRLSFPRGWVRVWKLHGSISWSEKNRKAGETTIVRIGDPRSASPDAVRAIYPSLEKYEESRRLPFVALADRFRRALAADDTIAIVAGYSFGDDHINELLFEAAELRPRSELAVLCFDEVPQLVTDRINSLPNLTVIARASGVVSGVSKPWQSPEGTSAFWDGQGVALGDFSVLSRVLRATAPDHSPDVRGVTP